MNKSDLINLVAERLQTTKKRSEESVEAIFDIIGRAMADGDKVTVPGFGSFSSTARAARNGVNPRTGKALKIAARVVPKFSAGKALKDMMPKPATSKKKK